MYGFTYEKLNKKKTVNNGNYLSSNENNLNLLNAELNKPMTKEEKNSKKTVKKRSSLNNKIKNATQKKNGIMFLSY